MADAKKKKTPPDESKPKRPRTAHRAPATAKYAPLKQWSGEIGFSYSTCREAALQGKFATIRIGAAGSRRQAIYVDRADGNRWVSSLPGA